MKKRNIFLALTAFFTSLSALISCGGGEYIPHYSVIYEYGTDASGALIKIDGEYRKAEFVKPGELATRPSVYHEVYGEPVAWCTDQTLTTPFNFSTPINEKTKLWAKWDQSEEKLTGVNFTLIGQAALSNMYAGDFVPLVENYVWAATPIGTAKYQNLKFTSSNENVAEVKYIDVLQTYAVYAKSSGSATLTVSADSVSEPITTYTDTATVSIKSNSNRVKEVKFTNPTEKYVEIKMGELEKLEQQLEWKVTGEYEDKPIVNDKVLFLSSKEEIATVDQNGKVTFLYKGTVMIIVAAYNSYDGELKWDCIWFNVDKTIHATDFELNAENLDLFYSDSSYDYKKSFQIEATFDPPETSDKNIEWTSSKPEIVSVKPDEEDDTIAQLKVNAEAPKDGTSDTVTITATHKNADGTTISHTCTIRLVLPTEKMSFATEEKVLKVNETFEQQPSLTTKTDKQVTDSDDIKGLTWTSSKPEVATVDENGKVTAVSGGTTIIKATNTYKELTDAPYAEYTVIVETELEDFSFDKTELLMFYKNSERTEQPKTYTLKVTYKPASATHQDLVWKSSDESVATVDQNGTISVNETADGIAKDVTITATHEESGKAPIVRECKVHVVMPVETMSFDLTETVNLSEGDTCNYPVTLSTNAGITPSEECSGVTWTSSNTDVATVDDDGNVTAVSGGDATITARNTYDQIENQPSASYKVHVYHKVEKISLSTNYIFFAEGYKDSETVSLTINPSKGIKDFDINWESGDKDVVNVKPAADKLSAEVTPGTKSGNTYIIVTVTDKYGTTCTTQCAVTNYDATATEDKLKFEKVDGTYTVSATGTTWGHIVIPDIHSDGTTVTKIKNNGFEGWYVTDIFIPNTIKSIGSDAFASCNALSMVLFSPNPYKTNQLETIGDNAFKPSKIGTSLEYIGLEYCANLKSIGASAFENQMVLESITIPTNVESIGDNAFNNCQSLQTVTIESAAIAAMDNPGALFTPLSTQKKVVRVNKNLSISSSGVLATQYTKTEEGNYNVYTQK